MSLEEALELLEFIPDLIDVGKTVHGWYQDWAQEQENQNKQLRQSVVDLLDKKEHEKALPVLQQLIQKAPQDKAQFLYLSAWCYYKLRRRDEALQACETAIQISTNEKLTQDIYALKAKIKFGFGFWIQWLIATVVVGAVGFFGVVISFGNQSDSNTSVLVGLLTIGASVGFVQWLLVRVRTTTGILSLILNVVVVLVSLTLATMALSVSNWLGLLVLLGCTAIFTTLAIGRLTMQPKATT